MKKTFLISAATITSVLCLAGCSGLTGTDPTADPSETQTETETTTVPPTTSVYSDPETVHYKSPEESQRDVSWDITVNKLEIKKYLKNTKASNDDYSARINTASGNSRFLELELTLKNTGYDTQSYITYESADIYTEILWDGNSYFPTYISDNPEGYQKEPISSYVDVEAGKTATVYVAFEVPKELGESDSPLRYHLFFKNGNGDDEVYIDLR